jgi:hypothetical protein
VISLEFKARHTDSIVANENVRLRDGSNISFKVLIIKWSYGVECWRTVVTARHRKEQYSFNCEIGDKFLGMQRAELVVNDWVTRENDRILTDTKTPAELRRMFS